MPEETSLKDKVFSGIKITTIITVYRSFFQFGTSLILVRLLSPDIFGSMAFAYLIVNLAGILSTLSSNSAIVQKKEERIERYIDVAFTSEMVLSVVASLVLIIISPFIMSSFGKPELSFYTQVISLTLPIKKLSFPTVIFTRNLDYKKTNIAPAISIPVNCIITILLAFLGFGIWSFFWGGFISAIVSSIVTWKILPYKPRIYFNRRIFKILLKFGLPLTGSALLGYYYWNVDDFMVGIILNEKHLGYYWLAFKIPHYILNAQNNAMSVVFPAFARAKDDLQLENGFKQATQFSAIILLLPCAIVLLFGEEIMVFLFGKQWLPAIFPFQTFMALITVRGIVGYWSQVLLVKGKTTVLLKITMQNAIILSFLGYWLTSSYGIIGTSISVFITIIASIPYMTWQLKKCIDISYIDILWRCFTFFFVILLAGIIFKKIIPNENYFISFSAIIFLTIMYSWLITRYHKQFIDSFKKFINFRGLLN